MENLAPAGLHLGRTGAQTQATGAAGAAGGGADGWISDVTTVPADPEGKRAHAVEVLHFVDAGTSIVLRAQPGADFHAETALEGVMQFFREYGLPPMLTFDNDPRFVGSSSGRDFPSACVASCCAWASHQT